MIRVAEVGDIPAILEIYAPFVTETTVTFEYTVPTLEEFQDRFISITAQFPWLVWEEDGKILGYAYASAPYSRIAYSWCAEPSVYLCPEAQHRGIGKKLYQALEAILLEQGYQIMYALITEENVNSVNFHENFGYKKSVLFENCGYKFGRWLGVYWMEKRLKDVEIPIDLPVSWHIFVQNKQKISNILDTLSLS